MIPAAQITNWRRDAPWANDDDVEQDLLISRAVVDLFNDPFLYDRLASGIFEQVAPLLVPGNPYKPSDAAAWFEATVLSSFSLMGS